MSDIIHFVGSPNEQFREIEPTIWRRFLVAIWPFATRGGEWAKYGGELAEAYAEARVSNHQNAAMRTAAEATEIAARADLHRQDAVRAFNEQIDSIFKDETLPPEARMLKLAKLMEANPALAEQIEKISGIVQVLSHRGAHVIFELNASGRAIDLKK